MKLPWFRHTNSGQLFCNCPRPNKPLLAGNQQRVPKLLSLCCYLKWLKIQTHGLPFQVKTNHDSQKNGEIKLPRIQQNLD